MEQACWASQYCCYSHAESCSALLYTFNLTEGIFLDVHLSLTIPRDTLVTQSYHNYRS